MTVSVIMCKFVNIIVNRFKIKKKYMNLKKKNDFITVICCEYQNRGYLYQIFAEGM